MTIRARIAVAAAVLALALWGGGLLALGAIVAPTVFGIVPAPASADAMTVVFQRFDRLAVGCAVVALAAEVALAYARKPLSRGDLARAAAVVAATALVLVEAAVLSPHIAALHAAGAIRGDGALGRELELFHHRAELDAKGQLLLTVSAIILHLFTLRVERDAKGVDAPSPPR